MNTPIIPLDADPIAHVEALRLAYDRKYHPSRLPGGAAFAQSVVCNHATPEVRNARAARIACLVAA